ncbi:MAG: PIN domain-containing protein [Bacteroidota bacterium]
MVDTSVLVAALVQGHPRHADALPYLSEAHRGSRHLLVAAHALAETYATLTALPISPRINPADARQLLEANVLGLAEIIPLDASDYEAVLDRMTTLALTSGAIYDALHVRAADKTQADVLVTLNGRDFRRMPPAPPCTLITL